MQTGFFANYKRGLTKVHLVDENYKPICGTLIGDDMEYQWCAGTAQITYVNCERCKRAYLKLEEARINDLRKSTIKHFDM